MRTHIFDGKERVEPEMKKKTKSETKMERASETEGHS